jgi:hypothetical protein
VYNHEIQSIIQEVKNSQAIDAIMPNAIFKNGFFTNKINRSLFYTAKMRDCHLFCNAVMTSLLIIVTR